MIDLSGKAAEATIGAGLLTPTGTLRWVTLITGQFSGPKADLTVITVGILSLNFVFASFWSEHKTVLSNENQEVHCEILSVLIAAVLCWWALLALTQIRFVWSKLS